MYQLSHLLSEQKSLLSALATTSILEETRPRNLERENKVDEKNVEEDNKQKLVAILEKVEGCKVKKLLGEDIFENRKFSRVRVRLKGATVSVNP